MKMFFEEPKYTELEKKVFKLLKNNFNSFFKHAIEHLTSEDNEYNRTMYIFSIQAALETLVKIYVLFQYGVLVILDFEQSHEINYRPKAQDYLLDLLNKKKLKTREYNELKQIILKDLYFSDNEKNLIAEFQKLRNQIAHMGVDSVEPEFVNKVNCLIARVFNDLDFKETISENYEMENTLEKILGKDLFSKYIRKSNIINETEKYVADNNDEHNIYYCLECGNKTSIYNSKSGDIKCYLCGYKVNTYYADVMECPNCFRKSLYFDVLNTTSENDTDGNCPCCGASFTIARCGICEGFYIPDVTRCFCK